MRRLSGLVLICGGCFTDPTVSEGTETADGTTAEDTTAAGPTSGPLVTTEPETETTGTTTGAADSSGSSGSSGGTVGDSSSGSSTGEPPPQWNPEPLWVTLFDSGVAANGDRADEVIIDDDDTLWVAGAFARLEDPSQMFLAHLDGMGVVLATHIYPGEGLTNARGLSKTADGFLLGGHTNSAPGGTDRLLVEFRVDTMEFDSPFDFGAPLPGTDIVTAVAADGVQRFAAGITQEDGMQRAWVQRLLPIGGAWTYLEGEDEGNHRVLEVHRSDQADNSDVLIAGVLTDLDGIDNAWVARLAPVSDVRWSRTYPSKDGGYSTANAVTVGASGNLFAVGAVEVPGEGLNAWVQRLAPDSGSPGWFDSFDGTGSDDAAVSVAIAPDGDVLICGRSTSLENGSDLWVARLTSAGDRRGAFFADLGAGLDDLITDCVVRGDQLIIAGIGYGPDDEDRDGFVAALPLDPT